MKILDVFRNYSLEKVRDVIIILDNGADNHRKPLDIYCPETIYESGSMYSQKSLKQKPYRVYASPDAEKSLPININMVYRLEHDTEITDQSHAVTDTVRIRFSTLFFTEYSLFSRLIVAMAVSELFIHGITPAVLVTFNAIECPVYGNITFVEHVLSPLPLEKTPDAYAASLIIQLLHIIDVLDYNYMEPMDLSTEDFVLAKFRSRKSFRGRDMSTVSSVLYTFKNGESVTVPLFEHRFLRLSYFYPIKLKGPAGHVISPDIKVSESILDKVKKICTKTIRVKELRDVVNESNSLDSMRSKVISYITRHPAPSDASDSKSIRVSVEHVKNFKQ